MGVQWEAWNENSKLTLRERGWGTRTDGKMEIAKKKEKR